MEVLYEYTALSETCGVIMFFGIFLSTGFLVSSLAYVDVGNKRRGVILGIISVLCALVVLLSGVFNEQLDILHDNYVEATFDDSYPFEEVGKQYKIHDQRGEIYVLIRKGD